MLQSGCVMENIDNLVKIIIIGQDPYKGNHNYKKLFISGENLDKFSRYESIIGKEAFRSGFVMAFTPRLIGTGDITHSATSLRRVLSLLYGKDAAKQFMKDLRQYTQSLNEGNITEKLEQVSYSIAEKLYNDGVILLNALNGKGKQNKYISGVVNYWCYESQQTNLLLLGKKAEEYFDSLGLESEDNAERAYRYWHPSARISPPSIWKDLDFIEDKYCDQERKLSSREEIVALRLKGASLKFEDLT